jgi:AcrR family transcriptional regulator
MSPRDALLPAPGRGQYDRRLPRERRLSEQRERLLAATALVAVAEPSPSVASIVRRAGVGRNTFYEYFDDVEHALDAARTAVCWRAEQALRGAESTARTPVERWRVLARAWLGFAEEEPGALLLVLAIGALATAALSAGGRVLEAALVRSLETLKSAGVTSPLAGAERVRAVAAVGEVFARSIARARLARDEPEAARSLGTVETVDRELYERSLVDVAVRLLR